MSGLRADWAARLRSLARAPDREPAWREAVEKQDRPAAVLIAFGPAGDDDGLVLLTQRAAHLRQHASQVAFPGGSLEPGEGPVQAALREAGEETHLQPGEVRVWGQLPPVRLAVTGFGVVPVLAWWPQPRELGWDPGETERAVLVSLSALIDPANRFSTVRRGQVTPDFEVGDLFIWGFTAGLLHHILEVTGLARPWDAAVLRDIPAHLGRPSLP